MKIVIAGVGSVGRSVALELLDHGHECAPIDSQPDKSHVASIADANWILTDAYSPNTFADAGLVQADIVVAVTSDDKANLVVSLLARTGFIVPYVVVRPNNPKNEWFFDASWSVDASVSTLRIITTLVGEAVFVDIPVRLSSFNSAEVSMYVIVLPEEPPLVGRRVAEVDPLPRTVLTLLLYSGRPIMPSDDDIFEVEDELLLLIPDPEKNALDTLTCLVEVPESEANEEAGEQV